MKTILAFLLSLICMGMGHAQDDWELAIDKQGIKVYVAELPDSEYYAFKAVMRVRTTETEILAILREVGEYPEWFAYTASTHLIHRALNEQTFFMETDYPWPFSNECMNYHMTFAQQGEGHKITIKEADRKGDCRHYLQKAGGYILLEPAGENLRITYYFHSEPSQSIPSWLINPRIHEMPYQTFLALRERVNPGG